MSPRSSFLVRSARSLIALLAARGGGRLLSLVVSVLLADRLGASSGTDAFFLARRLATGVSDALRLVVVYASIPPLVEVMRSTGGVMAERLWRPHLIRNVGLAILAAAGLAVAAPWVIAAAAPGFDADRLALGVRLFRILVFLIPIGLAIASMTSLLFASRRFGLTELVQLLPRVVVVILLLLLVPPLGVTALSWALLGGAVLVMLLLTPMLGGVARDPVPAGEAGAEAATRAAEADAPATESPRLGMRERALPIMLWQGYDKGAGWIDLAFASTLIVGGVSIFEYGQRLVYVLPAVLQFSLFTVMYTELAHLAAEGRDEDLKRTMMSSLRVGLFVLVLFVAFMWVAAEPIVELLLHHGAFGDRAAALTASVMRWLSLALPFVFVTNLLWRGLLADSTSPHLEVMGTLAATGILFRVGCVALLVGPMGVLGIALAASLSAIVLSGLAYRFAARQWGGLVRRDDLAAVARIVGCALGAGALMYGVREVAGVEASAGIIEKAALLAALTATGVISYLAAASVLGMEEVATLRELVRRRTYRADPGEG